MLVIDVGCLLAFGWFMSLYANWAVQTVGNRKYPTVLYLDLPSIRLLSQLKSHQSREMPRQKITRQSGSPSLRAQMRGWRPATPTSSLRTRAQRWHLRLVHRDTFLSHYSLYQALFSSRCLLALCHFALPPFTHYTITGSTLLSATTCRFARRPSSDARHDRIEWNLAPRSPFPSRLVVFGLLLACVDPVALLRWLFTATDRKGKTRKSRSAALAKEESQAKLLI
jgi:hypothetical protein